MPIWPATFPDNGNQQTDHLLLKCLSCYAKRLLETYHVIPPLLLYEWTFVKRMIFYSVLLKVYVFKRTVRVKCIYVTSFLFFPVLVFFYCKIVKNIDSSCVVVAVFRRELRFNIMLFEWLMMRFNEVKTFSFFVTSCCLKYNLSRSYQRS